MMHEYYVREQIWKQREQEWQQRVLHDQWKKASFTGLKWTVLKKLISIIK